MVTYPNLHHLKYFVDAVALGSMSRAAQKNFVTHPAVSRAISAIEMHLGISIVEHQKKSFKVTKKGLQVAEQAQILLSAASDFGKLKKTSTRNESVILRIGISRTLADIFLSSLLQDLRKEFPSLVVQVRFGATNEIIEGVANDSIDVGFTIGNQNLATLRQTSVYKGKFQLVQNKALSRNRSESAKSFVITEPRIETERLKVGYRRHFGLDLPVLFEINSWEFIGQLVQTGLGIGLLPDISVKNWKKGSFEIIKTDWFECSYEIYAHSQKNKSQSQVLEFAKSSLMQGSDCALFD